MRARDVAFIRKLCTLGLPPRAIVLSLLPAIRDLVPAHSAGVFWVDDAGEMTSLYAERLLPSSAMTAYYERHYANEAGGFAAAFKKRALAEDPVSMHSFTRQEQASAYFRDVLKPLDTYHVLYAILKKGRHPFAQLSMYRGERDQPFGVGEAATMGSLVRYLAIGLAEPDRLAKLVDETVVVEEELGIITTRGEVVCGSDAWNRLVRLAALSRVAPHEAVRERGSIDAFLREMGQAARGGVDSKPFESVRDTPWGKFTIKGFRLLSGGSQEQIGLLVCRGEPKRLLLVRGTGKSTLSPQQREVALLLAEGKTNPEIASELGLSPNTASYHVKQIYAKLDVNDRDEVSARLLALAHSAAAA